MTRSDRVGGAKRLDELDGLRGAASVVVLLHHLSLIVPAVSAVYLGLATVSVPVVGSAAWWMFATPLGLPFRGPEAVLVFFVISGLVLARLVGPRPAEFDWFAYVPQRLLRLGLPVAGSIALALGLILVSAQSPDRAVSGWLSGNMTPVAQLSPASIVANLDVLSTTAIPYNNPLWSLHYELLFSLLLPVFVLIGRGTRTLVVGGTVVVVATAVGSIVGNGLLLNLPAFAAGVLIERWIERISDRISACSVRRRTALVVLLAVLALVLLDLQWPLWMAGASAQVALAVGAAAAVLGAAAAVVLALVARPVAVVLRSRAGRHMGRLSFSLYLVHVPVLTAVASLLHGRSLLIVAGVALVSAVLIAEVFLRLIETPAHRLSRRVGGAIGSLRSSAI